MLNYDNMLRKITLMISVREDILTKPKGAKKRLFASLIATCNNGSLCINERLRHIILFELRDCYQKDVRLLHPQRIQATPGRRATSIASSYI